MAADDRVAVKTYVPRYQKDAWKHHADELEMSQSEFVRTMVQAGRSDFEVPSMAVDADDDAGTEPGKTDSTAGEEFGDRILEALDRNGVLGWDALVEELIDDVEDDLDRELQRLQDENLVRYSGRDGGYVVISDE